MNIAKRQIRAFYDEDTIRVYQAYSDDIADLAIENQTFISPPFKTTRMTWIKPSFLWMMYRSGWGYKDVNQKRILAIDISKQGFKWCLDNGCMSKFDENIYSNIESWRYKKSMSDVIIQWDPERNINLEPLGYRTIQIGIKGKALSRYLSDWITNISDITEKCANIYALLNEGNDSEAISLLPVEKPFCVSLKTGLNIKLS